MQIKIIQFLLTGLIIYILIVFTLTKYTHFGSVKSIRTIQRITMTFGATSFIYSYLEYIKSTNEKLLSVAEIFPQKWNKILTQINNDNSISSGIKQWVLKGKINEAVFRNLSLSDESIIEIIITTLYEVWLNMVSINLIKLDSGIKDYENLFKSKNNSDEFTKHLNTIVGVLFQEDFVLKHLLNEKKFYPDGFINYIIYCANSLRVVS